MGKKNSLSANPAPLGLLGFGATTILLNLSNAGIIEMSTMILAMGVFYGGIAQMIAGIMEFKNGKGFGTIAFLSYGSFWLTLVGLLVFPKLGWMNGPSAGSLAAYFIVWGIITLGFLFMTTKAPVSFLVFLTLVILFFLLAACELTGNASLRIYTGYEGIICGALAVYDALGQMINEFHGRKVFPM
jgi:succinate-acetate transporter protein